MERSAWLRQRTQLEKIQRRATTPEKRRAAGDRIAEIDAAYKRHRPAAGS